MPINYNTASESRPLLDICNTVRWPERYQPRPYLVAAYNQAVAAVDGGSRGILHLPTGVGKTVLAAQITNHYTRQGYRTLFIHHRKELGGQTLAKFKDFGLDPEIEESCSLATKDSRNPVIASVLSLQGRRLRSWPPDAFDIINTDECHHAAARSYQAIYDHFTGARAHLGLTATVDRYDRKSLLHTYPDGIIYSYSLLDAVLDGWLVRPKAVRLGVRPDLRKCKVVAGDYQAGELETVLSGHISDIAAAVTQEIGSRRTVAFTPTIASARALAAALRGLGLAATAVWGTCPDRDSIIARFRSGEIQVIVNVAVLGEGLDFPEVEAVVLARPTRSRSLYAQMVGRGLRIHPGKDLLLIIDFQWLTRKHQLLVDPTALLLADELPEVQAVFAGRTASDDPVGDVRRARATYMHSLEVTAYCREEAWLLAPPPDVARRVDAPPEWLRPTYKQLQALIAFRVAGWDKMTRVEANIAIAHAIHRRQCGLADYGLVRELVAAGISPPERALGLTDTQARRAQLRHILPAAVLAKVRTTLFTTN